jgi:hypothetical protein
MRKALKKKLFTYPDLKILLTFISQPNSKSLYSRLKERMFGTNVRFCYNKIKLEKFGELAIIDERMLIDIIQEVNSKKFNIHV